MTTFIYSNRYPMESFLPESHPIVLDFHKEKSINLTEKDFIGKAVYLSKRERISLDILEEDGKISADFITRTLVFSSESSHLLEELISSCDLLEIIASRKYPYAITIRLGRLRL